MASSSLPASRDVTACRWMGVGSVKPAATRLLQRNGGCNVPGVLQVGRAKHRC